MQFLVRSEFADDTQLVTGANPRPHFNIFPPRPRVASQNFPWVKQPAILCEAHRRRLVASGKADVPRVAPIAGDELACYDRDRDRAIQWHVQCGYRYADERAGVYRFTIKGAILGSWKLATPFKQIRTWLRIRKAKRAWRELGMDKFFPSVPGTIAN
jgi:hypothetical protein